MSIGPKFIELIAVAGRPGGLVVTLEYYVLAFLLEFDSHRGETLIFFQKCKKKIEKRGSTQPLRAPSSVIRYNSTRVEERRKCWNLLAIKMMETKGTYRSGEGGGRRLPRYVTTTGRERESSVCCLKIKPFFLPNISTQCE